MTGRILTTEERWQRHQRDLEVYRRRSLFRRSHARFDRDLAIIPHLFLAHNKAWMATLQQPEERIRAFLRGRAIWTLDTASRLVSGQGFLVSQDLTGYLSKEDLQQAEGAHLIGKLLTSGLSVDPLYRRPPMLIAHTTEEPIPFVELPPGDRVVTWDFLKADLMGTLGWRPDLLTRLEAAYPEALRAQSGAA